MSDTDAHSWVEVLYPGIGWVTVDPTPGQTPAHTNVMVPGAERGATAIDRALGRAVADSGSTRTRNSWHSAGPEHGRGRRWLARAADRVPGSCRRRGGRRRSAAAVACARPRAPSFSSASFGDALSATGFESRRPARPSLAIQSRLSASRRARCGRATPRPSREPLRPPPPRRPGPAERRCIPLGARTARRALSAGGRRSERSRRAARGLTPRGVGRRLARHEVGSFRAHRVPRVTGPNLRSAGADPGGAERPGEPRVSGV